MHPILENLRSELDALRMTARGTGDVVAWLRASGSAFVHATRALKYGDSYEIDDCEVYAGSLTIPEQNHAHMHLIVPWQGFQRVIDDSEVPYALSMTVVISTMDRIDLPAVLAAISKPHEFARGGRSVSPTGTAYQWSLEWAAVDWSWAAARCLSQDLRSVSSTDQSTARRSDAEVAVLIEMHLPNLPWATLCALANNGLLPLGVEDDAALTEILWEKGRAASHAGLALPALAATP